MGLPNAQPIAQEVEHEHSHDDEETGYGSQGGVQQDHVLGVLKRVPQLTIGGCSPSPMNVRRSPNIMLGIARVIETMM